MIEVFRYRLLGTMHDETIVSPCMATRAFIEAARGDIIKGSGRMVDDGLLGGGDRAVQGFTGEQVCYLRELISLGPITTGIGNRGRTWLDQLTANRLVSVEEAQGGIQYAITPLGRSAVAQLF